LFDQDHHVLGLKGQLTAELRWQLGLDTILEELPDSPAWQEKDSNKLRPGEKNRADHRHHAIDAVVVAMTNRSRLQQLSESIKRGGAKTHGEVLEDPWPNFREDVVQAIKNVNVSHRVERKVCGKLHEETLYGPTPVVGEWVVRKPVINLSPNEIERIRDATIRKLVVAELKSNGIEFGRGKKPDAKKMKAVLAQLRMPSGVPIKKVRLTKPELTIRQVRTGRPDQAFVKPGSTHHLCIFEWQENGKRKREAVFVSMLEAMNRLKRGEPVVHRINPERVDARFIMSLASREMVLANWKDGQRLLTFKTASSTQGQIWFAEHTDARKSSDYKQFVANANTLDARKVTVDALGRLRWAND
jgi:CRISPR-associated endonuclease Csn1